MAGVEHNGKTTRAALGSHNAELKADKNDKCNMQFQHIRNIIYVFDRKDIELELWVGKVDARVFSKMFLNLSDFTMHCHYKCVVMDGASV